MNQKSIEEAESKIFWPIWNHWTWEVQWKTQLQLIENYNLERKQLWIDDYCLRDKVDDANQVQQLIQQWWTVYEIMSIKIGSVVKDFITTWNTDKPFDGWVRSLNHRISSMLMRRELNEETGFPKVNEYSTKIAGKIYNLVSRESWLFNSNWILKRIYDDNKRLTWGFMYGLSLEEKFWYDILNEYLRLPWTMSKQLEDDLKILLNPLFEEIKQDMTIWTEYYLWFSSSMVE